jgi:polygalacturonase
MLKKILTLALVITFINTFGQNILWKDHETILKRIVAPTFRKVDYRITNYGAKEGGKADCTEAFKLAIEACNDAGGGRVVVPAGKFLTGPIHLKSNVNLHISKGATILFITDTKRYLPQVLTRFESIELMNYSPFIYALDQENIAITGEGVLDGQCSDDNWWAWKSKQQANNRLKEMAKNNVPVAERIFGEGDFLRPNFIQPYRCKNILIEGVTIINSPMWEINPVLSSNIIVRNVKINTHGPNNDGCDPESSRDVLIEGCVFDTGDDCIAIKSGRDDDGRRVNVPSENIIVRNCVMKDGHGGVVVGSEISGNVRNVFVEKCEMSSPHLERALRIKSNSLRGGIVENVFFKKVKVGTVSDAVVRINMYYMNETGIHHPQVKNVHVSNVTSKKSNYGLRIEGEEEYPLSDIFIENCSFENVANGNLLKGIKDITVNKVKLNGKELKIN